MLVLSKENMADYLRARYPEFCAGGPFSVSEIGDSEDDNPGLINHIFRVRCGGRRMIVKQGLDHIRSSETYKLTPRRNRLEYVTMKLRGVLVPQYVPEVYGCDFENNAFCMEDVSYLANARVALTRGDMPKNFGWRCGEFVAASTFYTSEFYLDTPTFRELSNTFTNSEMRRIMEQWLFLREIPYPDNPETAWMRESLESDDTLMAEIYQLRHQFMARPEGFIHGDLHTSNIFLDDTRMKSIDMEYTYAGPICYDMGYFINSIFTQYCSACLRPFPSEEKRREFQFYTLDTIASAYNSFMAHFQVYWDRDAKPHYRACPPWRDKLMASFLPDILGYAGIPTFPPMLSRGEGWMDFLVIPDLRVRLHAKSMAALISKHFLSSRFQYHTMEEVLESVVELCQRFMRQLGY